jgi:hypothetical protein
MIMCKIVFRSSTCSTKVSVAFLFCFVCFTVNFKPSISQETVSTPASGTDFNFESQQSFFNLTYAQGQTLQQNQATLCTISIINNFLCHTVPVSACNGAFSIFLIPLGDDGFNQGL